VPAGWGGSFSKTPFPYSPSLPTPTETRKITLKKTTFTVSRKILEPKGLTFENRNKNNMFFISIFGINLYI
jgi:hypothetical protein